MAIGKNRAVFPQLTLIGAYLDSTLAEDGGKGDNLKKPKRLCVYLQDFAPPPTWCATCTPPGRRTKK